MFESSKVIIKYKFKGEALNQELLRKIIANEGDRKKNIEALYFNNVSYCGNLFKKYRYHYENVDEVVSLLWLIFENTILKNYKAELGTSFGTYLYYTLHGFMQREYNYSGLVHYPVNSKYEKPKITNDEIALKNIPENVRNNEKEKARKELLELLEEFRVNTKFTEVDQRNFDIYLKYVDGYDSSEIEKEYNIKAQKVRQNVYECQEKIKKYMARKKKNENNKYRS